MADIAQIGFRAETSDLVDAKAKLEAISPAATKAEQAANKLAKAQTAAARAAQGQATAALAAARASEGSSRADIAAASAADKKAKAATAAARADELAVKSSNAAAAAARAQAEASDAAALAVARQGQASIQAAGQIQRLNVAANDNAGAFRANTSNIAAQFQDIGVTAAMGMDPLLIGLQQGTQLSAVLASSGASAGATLAAAFKSVLSPVSLLTIGLVSLAAIAIQYFSEFFSGSEKSADALKKEAGLIRKVSQEWGDALPALKAYNKERERLTGKQDLKDAIALAIKGEYEELQKVVNGLNVDMADLITQLQGFGADPSSINTVQQRFKQLFDEVASGKGDVETLRNVQKSLSDLYENTHISAAQKMAQAIGAIADEFERTVKAGQALAADEALLDFFKRSPLGGIGPVTSGGGEFLNPAGLQDFKANQAVYEQAGASAAADMIRGFEGFITKAKWDVNAYRVGYGSDTTTRANGMVEKVTQDTIVTLADAERDLSRRLIEFQSGIQKAIGIDTWNSLNEAQKAALSSIAYNYGSLPKTIVAAINSGGGPEIVAKAIAGLSANPARRRNEAEAYLSGSSMSLSDIGLGQSSKKTPEQNYSDIVGGAERRIETLKAERDAIGLSEEATAKLKYETELLNQARAKGIELTPQQTDQIRQLAGEMARLETSSKAAKDAMDFAKGVTKGFFADFISGIKNGEDAFESLGKAALGVLEKIGQKLVDLAIDDIFAGTNKSGGFLGSLLGGIGKLFGFAKGDTFANGINGHSNSIVSRPTLFAFASGAGVMGEAGPEAIMPLERGPDGSLGVQMYGSASPQPASNNNVDVTNVYQISGAISADQIVAEIKKTAAETVETTKKSVVGWLQQYSQDGSFA